MIFSLPNGKVIYLTFEEYLNLTDDDISYMISIDFGEFTHSPWVGSSLKNFRNSESIKDIVDFSEDSDSQITKPSDDTFLDDDFDFSEYCDFT